MIVPPLLQSQVTGLTTSDSPQFAGVNVGHASDSTITRVGAGQLAIEGVNVVTTSSTDTLTNKTIGAGALTMAESSHVLLDNSGSADEKWSGIAIDGTAGATLAVGDLCYLNKASDYRWELADADADASAGAVVLGLCILAGNDGDATRMLIYGTMRSAAFPASIGVGEEVYVDVTAGDISATAPSGTGDIVRVVGHAITAEPNTILFNPSTDWIELA